MNQELGIKNVLFIDTSNNKEIQIALESGGKRDAVTKEVDKRNSHVILEMISTLLIKYNLVTKDLAAINVNTGPGSFTGIRVGIAIANTLGLVLQIPVNGNSPGVPVEPRYQ